VLTRDEVALVLAELSGSPRRVCELLYGSGLRLLEALRLRRPATRRERKTYEEEA